MIDIRGMTPLIQVFDMPTSLAFYRDILGFSVKCPAGGAGCAAGGAVWDEVADPDGCNLCFQWPTDLR